MERKETNKKAKEFCKEFLRERISEAQKALDRLTVCYCEQMGGPECDCTAQSADTVRSDTTIENGGTDMNGDGGLPFSSTEKDLKTNADEKDSFAKPKGDVKSSGIAAPAVEKTSKPITLKKQPSTLDQVYEGLRNPYVILINNVNFNKRPAPRNGAEVDTKNLKKFLGRARFNTVKCYFDLKKVEMMKIFRETQKDYNLFKHDGLMCFIMSHGGSKGIETADNHHIEVEDITRMFRGNQCPQFATKPKLFFIQACRGDDEDEGFNVPRGPNNVESDSIADEQLPVKMPSDSDFLIAYSTTKEKCSYRRYIPGAYDEYDAYEHLRLGSWFIECLVDVLLAYAHEEDLLSMLTRVNNAMAELYSDMGYKQISCHLSILTKKLYFPTLMELEKSTS